MKPIVDIKNLSKCFGEVKALDHISFSVNQGEWVALMGPSGSGKTTLLNILSCLDEPTTGQYLLEDVDTASLKDKERTIVRREKIGLIFQQFHLIPYLTALENVMLAQYYHSITDKQEAGEALQRVGMGHRVEHLPSQLSGGEQQRVCIARALINEPAILMADEPTGNLDEKNEAVVLELLEKLHKEGKTIILVTHNPEMGNRAQRMIQLHHGQIENDVLINHSKKRLKIAES
jgi:putative ABC transport system ATP-binding protein